MANEQVPACQTRWWTRRDFKPALAIEREAFDVPWTHVDFVNCLNSPNTVGMVAERSGTFAGFCIYQMYGHHLHLFSIAVAANQRRSGIGRALVDNLKGKLSLRHRHKISCEVRETNLGAQLFFKSLGFRARFIARNFYDDFDEDALVVEFALPETRKALPR